MKRYPQTQLNQKTADDTSLTRTRPARRNASTVFRLRLVRGTLDGTPRPRPISYEARSIKHLDRVLTRTRLVRLSANLRLARPRVGTLDPLYSPNLRQKSEHLIPLPATSYHHGYSRDRRGSSVGASSYFLLPIPGWEVKTCHYAHHTAHCFATNHPRGRIQQGPYPTISGIRPYPPGLDPASTQRRSAGRKGRRGTGLRVFSPSRPRRHHGFQRWPAIPRARRYSCLYRDRQTSPQGTPASRPPLTL
jgi:hypothetical protein